MITLIVVLWCLVVLNWLRFRDAIYPGLLQSSLWAVVVSLFYVSQDDFLPVGETTWLIIGSGVLTFSIGCLLATEGHVPFRSRNYLGALPMRLPSYSLVFVVVAFLPFVIARAHALASGGPFQSGFANLRYSLSSNVEGTGGYGILAYLVPIAFFAAALQLLRIFGSPSRRQQRERLITLVAVTVGVLYGLLSSGRGILFMLLCIVFIIPVVLRAVRPVRAFTLFLGTSLSVFVALGVLTGKGGSVEASISDNFVSMARSMETYLLASIPAFDRLISIGSPYDNGANAFRTVFAILHSIGFEVRVDPLVQAFVYVPMPTNIYTVYQPYFMDFGLIALPLFQFVFGLIHGFFYRRATVFQPHPLYVFLFSLSMFPLFTQYGGDAYFSLLSMWVQYLIYSFAFLVVFSRRTKAHS